MLFLIRGPFFLAAALAAQGALAVNRPCGADLVGDPVARISYFVENPPDLEKSQIVKKWLDVIKQELSQIRSLSLNRDESQRFEEANNKYNFYLALQERETLYTLNPIEEVKPILSNVGPFYSVRGIHATAVTSGRGRALEHLMSVTFEIVMSTSPEFSSFRERRDIFFKVKHEDALLDFDVRSSILGNLTRERVPLADRWTRESLVLRMTLVVQNPASYKKPFLTPLINVFRNVPITKADEKIIADQLLVYLRSLVPR